MRPAAARSTSWLRIKHDHGWYVTGCSSEIDLLSTGAGPCCPCALGGSCDLLVHRCGIAIVPAVQTFSSEPVSEVIAE